MIANRGFTLIETIVYCALLGLVLTGAVVTSYQLVASSGTLAAKNTTLEEGTFVLGKLAWALSGAQTIAVPGNYDSTLTVVRYDGIVVDFALASGSVQMRESAGAYAPLTTSNVQVSALGFQYVPAAGGKPAGVVASTTINGMTFYTAHFLRK